MAISYGNAVAHYFSVQTPSFSHDNNGDLFVLCIEADTTETITTAPTFNGVTMTLAQKIAYGNGTDHTSWQYYLPGPASGSHTLTWEWGDAVNCRCLAMSLIGGRSSPLGAMGSQTGAGKAATVTLENTVGGSLIVAVLCKSEDEPVTPGAGVTERDDGKLVTTDSWGWVGTKPGGGDVTIDCDWEDDITDRHFAYNVVAYLPPPPGNQILIMG